MESTTRRSPKTTMTRLRLRVTTVKKKAKTTAMRAVRSTVKNSSPNTEPKRDKMLTETAFRNHAYAS